jgi:hypothetical protein
MIRYPKRLSNKVGGKSYGWVEINKIQTMVGAVTYGCSSCGLTEPLQFTRVEGKQVPVAKYNLEKRCLVLFGITNGDEGLKRFCIYCASCFLLEQSRYFFDEESQKGTILENPPVMSEEEASEKLAKARQDLEKKKRSRRYFRSI